MDDVGDAGEDSVPEWNSGPFCRHWGDPIDCDILCANCGHRCPRHSAEDGETDCLLEDGCPCEAWVEPE